MVTVKLHHLQRNYIIAFGHCNRQLSLLTYRDPFLLSQIYFTGIKLHTYMNIELV